MATSLAKQLKKLQIPGQFTHSGTQAASKKSFLFSCKDSASIDLDSVYWLGVNGLEELTSMDASFAQYTETLFSETSKDFERSILPLESAKKVDNEISGFLRLLSPYFLLRPAHKCLEWLVRVYEIHKCNVDALMECVLPYYETNLFVRVVQILDLDDHASSWAWLSPIQKEGVPLSRLSLVQHCLSDGPFLIFVCNMVVSSLSVRHGDAPLASSHRVLLSFYVSTVCQVIERGPVTEELVGRLLPFVAKGLGSLNVEYVSGTYMIIGVLGAKIQLSSKVVHSLIESIVMSFSPSLIEEAVYCLLVLAAHSETLTSLSNKSIKGILSRKDLFLPALEELSTHCDTFHLLRPLLRSMIDSYFKSISTRGSETNAGGLGQILIKILSSNVMETETVTYLIKYVLDQFCDKVDKKSSITSYPFLTELVQAMDTQYPTVLDTVLVQERGGDRRKMVEKFVSLFLTGTRHEISVGNSNDAIDFYHHDSSVRLSALRSLKSIIIDGSSCSRDYDQEFISSVLLSRLSDDDPNVVKAVLELGEDVLLRYVSDKTELLNVLKPLCSRQKMTSHKSQNWLPCIHSALSIITSKLFCEDYSVDTLVLVIVPLLSLDYYWKDQYRTILEIIAESHLATNCQTVFTDLSSLIRGWLVESSVSVDDLIQRHQQLIAHLAEGLVAMETDRASQMVDGLLSLLNDDFSIINNHLLHFLIIPMLAHALQIKEDAPPRLSLALSLTHYLCKSASLLSTNLSPNLTLTPTLDIILRHLIQRRVRDVIGGCHAHLLLWLINQLIDHTVSPTELPPSLWLCPPVISPSSPNDQFYYYILLNIFSILTESNDSKAITPITDLSRSLLQKLFKVHFRGRGSLLRFLAMIWCSPVDADSKRKGEEGSSVLITEVSQVRALRIARVYLEALDHSTAVAMLSSYCPVVASLILPLASPNINTRAGAFQCIQALHSSATDSQSETLLRDIYSSCPLLHLLDYIISCSVEIRTDPLGLQLSLQALYSKDGGWRGRRACLPRFAPPDVPPSAKKRRGQRAVLEEEERVLGVIVESLLLMIVGLEKAPNYMIQQLLTILSGVDIKCKLMGFLKLLKELVQRVKEHEDTVMDTNEEFSSYPLSSFESELVQLLVYCYTPVVSSWLETEADVMELFLYLLSSTSPLSPTLPSLALMAINQITPQFYSSLTAPQLQQSILHSVLDLMIASTSSSLTVAAKQSLQQLPLRSELMIAELLLEEDKLKPNEMDPTTSNTKRRKSKTHTVKTGKGVSLLPWKRVTALLEVMPVLAERMGAESHGLVPPLFSCLTWSFEEREISNEDTLDYTQQLILSNLLKIYNILGDKETRELLPEESFNVEQVVQCLRHSVNPQTQHLSLLLLSTTASTYPDRILHNLMPVFAFMGSNLLRQDDSYTFEVINRTLESIVPTLVKFHSSKSSAKTKRRSVSKARPPAAPQGSTLHWSMAEVIRVFVDAVPHIPDHRRLPLLSHLVRITGPSHSLYLTIGLMIEKAAIHAGVDNLPMSPKDEVRLMLSLSQKFPSSDQLLSLTRLLEYCREHLPQDKPDSRGLHTLSPDASLLFDVRLNTSEQLRGFRLTLVSLMSLILEKMKRERSSEGVEFNQELVMNVLQECLYYINILNKYKGSSSGDAPTIKYWDSVIEKVNNVIDKLVSLLSVTDFLTVLLQLMDADVTRRKAMTILAKKLEDKKWNISQEQDSILMEHVNILMTMITEGGGGEKGRVTQQSALHCLRQLITRIGDTHPQEFVSVTQSILDAIGEENEAGLHQSALSSALLCISVSCTSLTVHVISLLPSIISTALKYTDNIQSGVVLSAVTLLRTVTETLPRFISSYVPIIITKMCGVDFIENSDREDLVNEAALVRESLPVGVPSRVLLPALSGALPLVMEWRKCSVIAVVKMLRSCIAGLAKKHEINQPILIDIFKCLLEYRSKYEHESEADVMEVESEINQSFTDLVVKLSEASFKPTLNKLLLWADSGDKLITFYHLMRDVARKLKVLFILFADQLVEGIVSLLSSCHLINKGSVPFKDSYSSSISKTHLCLQLLFDTLHVCFLHDKGQFLNKERFQQLMEPLFEQLTNTLNGEDTDMYQSLMRSHLSPCITQLAVATAGRETQWKQLNHQLLMKTRESNPMVRLCALQIAGSMYSKLGQEVNVILPETIPFLSELMEDECEEVEKEVQTTIATIETVTGESVQQYL